MDLPKNMPMDQMTNLVDILANKMTGATIQEIRAVNNNISEKGIDAAVFVGLVSEQSGKYIITGNGKQFYQGQDPNSKGDALKVLLKKIDIYNLTIEYFHHNKIEKPTKLDVGTYWNSFFSTYVKGMNEDDLTSSIIFFLKLLDLASLGKYINAGNGRVTRIDLDMVAIAIYITASSPLPDMKSNQKQKKETTITETEKEHLEEANVSGSLSILKKLNPELVWNDLDSDGAKKLIIDKLNVLSNQNIVLTAKVEEFQKQESVNAVLKEKVFNLRIDNLFRASVNSLGGIVLGVAITLDQSVYQIVGCLIGGLLVGLSIFLKQSEATKTEESI